ncbi:iron-siderophore ABC transporter substrate-binding protein [Actinoplanes sp. NEAU-A12]|uniref:Iron-siderophore ABC transporter substrate-binding protein n=1 Tax=Actinoplanes sandaracinus TaxID=3045177 RepID=A0ABT6WI17_9ACTN|nr:iron-siderophore ABC transporter substrate-binding protein [Actinoplanes sandaracinus]MDI6099369.1 iron-siderophore ABC transporter substrate-binding protein [Actinoplanes sandaracinus]
MRRFSTAALIAVALTLGVAGCASDAPPSAPAGATRPVTHAMGTTEVPASPQRVVVLDTDKVDTALSLGIVPVGAARAGEASGWPAYLGDKVSAMKEVGVLAEPDLEAISALRPDLILGSKFRQEKFYDELSAIAPTVFTEKVGITWKENFLLDGAALGKQQQARDLLAAYETRAKQVGTKIGTPGDRKISIVRFMPAEIRVYGPESFSGIVVGDVGLGRTERQLLAGKDDKRFDKVSPERLAEVDGEVIFYCAYGEKAAAQQAGVTGGDLWKNLAAVKASKVYPVTDETWMLGIGVTAAGKILDDLEKHLTS